MIERARSEGLEPAAPDDFRSVTGTGVVASLDGRDVVVGTPDLLSERGVNSGGAADALEAMRSRGRTAVLVASDGEVLGVIAIADRVEEGSRDAIGQLRTIGVEPVTMTGDHEGTARAVGAEVGIGRILADVLPDEKAEEIGRLQDQGHRVATVGDGINDGPALTRPDVCVALGAGTD
ncbi:MAG: HAD-IC family P-type ATPase, partial [Gemmatimonadetes bacterium]|nr:HAD-IC family P-type ATPase [Gemmatimonadota bacterium]NIR78208.1 HAD-IC family P-type ATPase [Gemmatimonadota bacterium]NIT89391.1 HAD-IC family P-type ATPase [Gemmatimonadota bacterium]NIU30358.1 HAD-IC family P-type ATPase [Gemmatimonadota bacterium]NIU35243.1 HAD-IC family P-type ATPase [Gemmatimonadota bacterium]